MRADDPISTAEFARSMAALPPFESEPRIAVGLSGGPDSMALALLLDDWVKAAGGTLVALTVDHRLRPESQDEARQVAAWMAARGIAHSILVWDAEKPVTGIQAAARTARYELLERACVEAGILHLALGHQQDDQAETLLLRLAKGSGIDGIAGMSSARETAHVRLIRPLLEFPKTRLRATCTAFHQLFLEDPSNAAERFARGRLRGVASLLAAEGLDAASLAEAARRAGVARASLEQATARALARLVATGPERMQLDRSGWLSLDQEIRLRVLAALVARSGGLARPPRRAQLERLDARLGEPGFAGATLAGCRIRVRAQNWEFGPEQGRADAPRRPLSPNRGMVASQKRNIM